MMDQQYSAAQYKDNPKELVYNYSQYFDFYKKYNLTPKHIAVVGGAAYSVPQAYVNLDENVQVDVYELEPQTVTVANKYFNNAANHSRIHTILGDARIELSKNNQKYDVIFLDAFSAVASIPWQLTTTEFYEIVRDSLTPDGVVITNVIANIDPNKSRVLDSFVKTQHSVFDSVTAYNAYSDEPNLRVVNCMLIARNSAELPQNNLSLKYITDEKINKSSIDLSNIKDGIVLHDNYAPIEYYGLSELLQ